MEAPMSMTARRAAQLLDALTSRLAPAIGFSRMDKSKYGRLMHDATGLLLFPWRLSPRGVAFTARVGLRFESLGAWLDDDPADRPPTLALPIHFLREDKSYTEW